jgi:hypothetical protein
MKHPSAPSLDLPPPFKLVTLREVGDAFAHAVRIASQEGAGTLVHTGRFDVAEFAVVLEPVEPLRTARRLLYAGLVALGDALAALAPPERPLSYCWPDAVLVDGALVGGARLAWPAKANEDAPPEWLVFAAMIRTGAMDEDPGRAPVAAALEQEGFAPDCGERLVEGFSRHLMRILDDWGERGAEVIMKAYLARLGPAEGLDCSIESNGDLLVRRGAKAPRRRSLRRALREPSWLDPDAGAPRA